jgi:hypothetical protein
LLTDYSKLRDACRAITKQLKKWKPSSSSWNNLM